MVLEASGVYLGGGHTGELGALEYGGNVVETVSARLSEDIVKVVARTQRCTKGPQIVTLMNIYLDC